MASNVAALEFTGLKVHNDKQPYFVMPSYENATFLIQFKNKNRNTVVRKFGKTILQSQVDCTISGR